MVHRRVEDKIRLSVVHFTVVCLVTWPLSGSEVGGDTNPPAFNTQMQSS